MPTFFVPFFNRHYARNEIAESIGMSREDLSRVTAELLRYMRGRRESLEEISAVAIGRDAHENFFSQREIKHMFDVRELYKKLFAARAVAFFLLIALVFAMILAEENPLRLLARCSREVLAGFLGVAAIVAIFIAVDFERAWDVFHYVFFRGDAENLWRLTPFSDLMINMFPLEFFLGIAIFFASLVIFFSAAIIAAASFYLRANGTRRL